MGNIEAAREIARRMVSLIRDPLQADWVVVALQDLLHHAEIGNPVGVHRAAILVHGFLDPAPQTAGGDATAPEAFLQLLDALGAPAIAGSESCISRRRSCDARR